MAFVNYNQVKGSRGEESASVSTLCGVDGVHHGWVGAEYDSGRSRIILAVHEAGHRNLIAEEIHKTAFRLTHQCSPISQKKNALHPAATEKHIGNADGHPCLACACGLNDQRLPPIAVKLLLNHLHCLNLIRSARNIMPRLDIRQRLPESPPVHSHLQVLLREEPGHITPWIARGIIQKHGAKPVRQENKGSSAVFFLIIIGIKHSLLCSLFRVIAGALGLHDGKGLPVPSQKHIIRKTRI